MRIKSFYKQTAEGAFKTLLVMLLMVGMSPAWAETLMMPERQGLVGDNVVVWGVTDQVGNYTLNCGNGTSFTNPVTDGSYIAHICNYAGEGTFTATLSTTGDAIVAAVDVAIFDGSLLSAADLRGVRINTAIEDGLRNLWVTQEGRAANFPAATTTTWVDGWRVSASALATLAFENQGYTLANDGSAPTGVYEKYIVRRGLNYVISALGEINIATQPSGFAGQPIRDPCVGVGIEASPCTGYRVAFRHWPGSPETFHEAYQTGVGMLPLAGSGALNRVNTEVAGPTNGKTYGEILQRMTNALAWGQIDGVNSGDRGGWYYNFNSNSSDGSTIGWDILAMLDAEAAGVVVPAWVKTELQDGGFGNLNNDGSIDYQADGNPAANSSVGPAKNGIGLQGLALFGELLGPRVNAVRDNINSWWSGVANSGIGGDSWGCGGTSRNKGCGYAMYNNFKGLKLHAIQTLPNVGRAAGPGAIPANDWHEDYKDWAIANQSAPNTVAGGSWGPAMTFSSIHSSATMETALIELMLSPVALVLPDPVQFGEFGLKHCIDGPACAVRTIADDINPVGTDHTVIARAESVNQDPIPGTTIDIDIISGPNVGLTFQAVTNASGEVQFTYTSNGSAGIDEIQASIVGVGINSNLLNKIWRANDVLMCDVDVDGDIDRTDIRLILRMRRQPASGPDDPADADGDGRITSHDAKLCIKKMF